MVIIYHPQFERDFKRLSNQVQKAAYEAQKLFQDNPYHPPLKTHKLHGKLRGLSSFSVNRKYRIVFEFVNDDVIFLMIGNHDIYQ